MIYFEDIQQQQSHFSLSVLKRRLKQFTILSISLPDRRYLLAGTLFSTTTLDPNCPKLRSLNAGSMFSGIEMSTIFVYNRSLRHPYCATSVEKLLGEIAHTLCLAKFWQLLGLEHCLELLFTACSQLSLRKPNVN